MRKISSFIFILMLLLMSSCNKNVTLQNGIWKGELALVDNQKAPFLFEVSGAGADSTSIVLINGAERVSLKGVVLFNDSITIPIEAYDAVIQGVVKKESIEGRFIKNYIEGDTGVVFSAQYDKPHRFEPAVNPTKIRIDGKWDVLFIDADGDTSKNVGVFKSSEEIVTGSILTNSGDLRFLEGNYTSDGVQLSAFSGLSPYLLNFKFVDDNNFKGTFFTTRGKTTLVGTRNEKADLADPYSLATLKAGKQTLSFSLPNIEGKKISLDDETYKGKVVIVSILGSWCPNCLDEMAFLAPWYDENKNRGVEIIGVAFERKNDFEYAQKTLTRLKNKYNTNYTLLFAGEVGKESVSKTFPEIVDFSSYPTTIFIDKKGTVRKIHTGFTGPATGLFYDEFKKDFNELVDSLLAE